MKKMLLAVLATWMIVFGVAGAANATLIVGPASATTTAGEIWSLEHSFDQSGLSANYVSGVTDFDVFTATTTHSSNPGSDYVSTGFGTVTYDLGQLYLIEELAFWNFGGGSGNGIYAITAFDLYGNSTFLGNYNPSLGGGLADIYSFGPILAQTIQLDVISSSSSFFGIGEVAFGVADSNPIPEPTTILLLGVGIAGLAGMRMRRKKMQK